eukprot:6833096-Prymnesium_polylepis.1
MPPPRVRRRCPICRPRTFVAIGCAENLAGVKTQPVRLKPEHQAQLIYSPHSYGPSVYLQNYFKEASFPANMDAIWEWHFAFVQGLTGQPVVIGE